MRTVSVREKSISELDLSALYGFDEHKDGSERDDGEDRQASPVDSSGDNLTPNRILKCICFLYLM